MNKVLLTGRTTGDVVLNKTKNGKSVADFRLAVKRTNSKDKDNTDFIPVTVFGSPAEAISKNVGKGSLITVEGELRIETYENREGAKRTKAYVLCGKADFVSLKKPEGFAAPSPEAATETPAPAIPEVENEDYSDLESDTLPF